MKLYLDKDTDISKLTVDDINNMLIDKIRDYVKTNQNVKLEIKPDEFEKSTNSIKRANNIEDELEELKLTSETKIDRQLYNISENITLSYFSLSDEKFMAILERVKEWGLSLTLEEFIKNYYLFNKSNKYLKQFIIMHFDKLIKITSQMIEKQLIDKFKLYNFNSNNTTLKTLKQNLIEKEKELQKVKPSDLIINRNDKVVDMDQIAQMKLDVLNDLKKSHPELEG